MGKQTLSESRLRLRQAEWFDHPVVVAPRPRKAKTRLAKKRPLPSPATWVAFRDSEATEWNGISYANFYAMLKR